ncbi:Naringenin 3-dioxygenase [Scheffersomyces stipitis CBS 6054]|uniref:Naringenin 3-dioxygenase n=1 Tax=Scheffersomyces stipitis (strain ATCC 58785 / CBS 6054 / NBRC 10063 / NRRL Y-11545) TaxID=322104 RepID=A3LVX7_PICST|nr:Naringenin 3-dioxygenase [Scheffersomyces stipitis CBS 6054]ABN66860.2 Naringenin 3-dioxygenase [Scheffersomyces stipitis CBS 6054]
MSFQEIPIIDLKLGLDPATKPQFLQDLRHALINVGFLLLKNYEVFGPNDNDLAKIKQQAFDFFDLPDDVKLGCEMINSPHFLGYTRLANEITASHTDWREQIDLGTELPAPGADEPIYRNIEGPNLWPDASAIPGFRPTITDYIAKMTNLSSHFRDLVLEAIGLEPSALDSYFKPNQQCKMKLVAYPDSSQLTQTKSVALDDTPSTQQGVGPHRDSDLLTYIFQATEHTDSLQVQNFQGQWITVPNIPRTLVVNAGQTLEAISQGVCKATIHRVLIPKPGSGTRISIPFFQTIDLDSYKSVVEGIPADVLQSRDERDKKIKDWGVDVGFQFKPDVSKHPVGYAVFRNRIKSHQDVAARWYPSVLKEVLQEYKF